jgi:hypothetical protein
VKQKIPIWVNFGGHLSGKYWYILRSFGIIDGHLVYFVASGNVVEIWYISRVNKNPATLVWIANT